jgi:hypothetical protein
LLALSGLTLYAARDDGNSVVGVLARVTDIEIGISDPSCGYVLGRKILTLVKLDIVAWKRHSEGKEAHCNGNVHFG